MVEFEINKIGNCSGHKGSVFALIKGLNAGSFYSSGEDGLIVEWSVNEPDLGKPIAQMKNSVYSLLCWTEKSYLVVAQNFSGLHFIDLKSNQEIHAISIPDVRFFDLIETNDFFLLADSDGRIHLINKSDLSLVKTKRFSDKSARSISILESKKEAVVGFSDNFLRLISLPDLNEKSSIEGHQNSIFSTLVIEEDIYSVARDAKIKKWVLEAEEFTEENSVPAHLFAINKIIYIAKKKLIVSCSMDKSIKIWQLPDLKLLKVINKAKNAAHGTSINTLLWLEDEQMLISGGDDKNISIWKLFSNS